GISISQGMGQLPGPLPQRKSLGGQHAHRDPQRQVDDGWGGSARSGGRRGFLPPGRRKKPGMGSFRRDRQREGHATEAIGRRSVEGHGGVMPITPPWSPLPFALSA